jgi:hypothetical protein
MHVKRMYFCPQSPRVTKIMPRGRYLIQYTVIIRTHIVGVVENEKRRENKKLKCVA